MRGQIIRFFRRSGSQPPAKPPKSQQQVESGRTAERACKNSLCLLWAAFEPRDAAVALPWLDIVAIDELSCRCEGCVVVESIQIDRFYELAVQANNVNAIARHR